MSETNKLYAGLYDNPLTEQAGDCTAKPKVTGTLYNEDVAQQIVKERTEFREETILTILTMADKIKSKAVSEGKIVIDGVGQYSVIIKGVFEGPTSPFDRTKHRLMASYSAGKALREQLAKTEVETEQALAGGPVINVVYDPTAPDTRDQLPFRGMAVIEGNRIALRGTPENAAVIGITFTPVNTTDGDSPVFIAPAKCAPNSPTRLQFVLPAEVTTGDWHVKVTTQYSSSSSFTKEARTYEYTNIVSVF